MNCPLCIDTVLDITFHAGIEVDICPRCRGVWLDRGELDRIASGTPRPSPVAGRSDTAATGTQGPMHPEVHDPGIQAVRKPKKSKKSKKRKKTFADRLGDVFEEIIDL